MAILDYTALAMWDKEPFKDALLKTERRPCHPNANFTL